MADNAPQNAAKERNGEGRIGRWLATVVLLLVPLLAISAAEDAVGGIRSIMGGDTTPRPAVRSSGVLDARTSAGSAVQIDGLETGEAGLMDMAMHPSFPQTAADYFTHSYRSGRGIRNRLIRATYRDGALTDPETVLDDIPGRLTLDGRIEPANHAPSGIAR